MKVGARIKQQRIAQKMTLKALSEKADISISFLSDIESGRSNPSLDRLREISAALDCRVSLFLEDPYEAELWGEQAEWYTTMDHESRELLQKLLGMPDFMQVLREFDGFECWSEGEKAEMISLLKTKREYRRS